MIEKFKCSCCKIRYELSWDDCEELYAADVEELDDVDYDDTIEYPEPSYCPFCGGDICDDDIDDVDF
jgi:hypothetical protein